MVLVDAAHEDQRVTMGGKPQRIRDFATGRVRPEPRIAADTAWLALRRTIAPRVDTRALAEPLDRLSRSNQDAWRTAAADTAYRLSREAEMDWSPEEVTSMHTERLRDRATLGDLPLIVLSRTVDSTDAMAAERAALQRDLAALSRHGRQITATRSGHNIHLEDPALVVGAIRDVVMDVRHAPRRK